MNNKSHTLPGINIQWPISEIILSGKKTVETRTYPLPVKYQKIELFLIETPGKSGNFKARVRGVIIFENSFKYPSKKSFYKDSKKHCVTPSSPWAWQSKPKWGWKIASIKVFKKPIPAPDKRGIVFTRQIKIKA